MIVIAHTLHLAKKKRITFMECNNDVNCMIDVAKTADLVSILYDTLLMCMPKA